MWPKECARVVLLRVVEVGKRLSTTVLDCTLRRVICGQVNRVLAKSLQNRSLVDQCVLNLKRERRDVPLRARNPIGAANG